MKNDTFLNVFLSPMSNPCMKKKPAVLIFCMLLMVFIAVPLSGAAIDIIDYLPKAGELGDWNPSDDLQHMKGEDLFLLINGGAEVYHEYGFKEVLAQGFKNKNKKSFNLEIFRMTSPDAAYGIYTFKTGQEGKPLEVGDEGLLEEYYLNFRKGSYLVTITGFDSEKETIDGLIHAANVIAAKIKESAPLPAIINCLPPQYRPELKQQGIVYLKGPLSLYNQYAFDSKDIFEIKEGLAAEYNSFKLFLFKYPNNKDANAVFSRASKMLGSSDRFNAYRATPATFYMKDKNNHLIYGTFASKYIIVLISKQRSLAQLKEITGHIQSRL